jgi:hypothetical protein
MIYGHPDVRTGVQKRKPLGFKFERHNFVDVISVEEMIPVGSFRTHR